MSAVKKFKEEAPKWTTYFTKLQIRIMYRILFYANNSAGLSFASQEKIASDCTCSRMSVYRTYKKACSLGVLENQTKTKKSIDYKTGLIYFKKRLALKVLGDVVLKQSDAFISLNVTQNVTEIVTLYNKKRNSLKREERKAPFSFSLEDKIEEELKDYPESLKESFKNHLESKYENKRHFIPIDFKEQLERFKKHNPLKKCYTCNQTYFNVGSVCKSCLSEKTSRINSQEEIKLEAQDKAIDGLLRDLGINNSQIVQEANVSIQENFESRSLKKAYDLLRQRVQRGV